jgi:hypothetical protein
VPYSSEADSVVVRVWDLATGDVRDLGTVDGYTASLHFTDDEHIVWRGGAFMLMGETGEEAGASEVLFELTKGQAQKRPLDVAGHIAIESEDGSYHLTTELTGPESRLTSRLLYTDHETGQTREISNLGSDPYPVAIGPSEDWIVTGGANDGIVRVGRISGGEPHLLYGHRGQIPSVKVSPDGRWIASGGKDTTLRIWPMPDLTKPPFHTLPYEELMPKLETLTNLRVVRDEESSTGWAVKVGPFPGWETVPEW